MQQVEVCVLLEQAQDRDRSFWFLFLFAFDLYFGGTVDVS